MGLASYSGHCCYYIPNRIYLFSHEDGMKNIIHSTILISCDPGILFYTNCKKCVCVCSFQNDALGKNRFNSEIIIISLQKVI